MGKDKVLANKEDKNIQVKTKVTWDDIWADFRHRFPNLQKNVRAWKPHSFATIKLYLKDGGAMLYNYDIKRADFIQEEKIVVPEDKK